MILTITVRKRPANDTVTTRLLVADMGESRGYGDTVDAAVLDLLTCRIADRDARRLETQAKGQPYQPVKAKR